MSGEKVFRSFGELREHFFPERAKKERARAEVETILDEAKFDRPVHKRQLSKDDKELAKEVGL